MLRIKMFRILHFFSILATIFVSLGVSQIENDPLKKYEPLRITEKNHARVFNLHTNWYCTAIKSLIGQLGKQLYKQISKAEKYRLGKCLDRIENQHDLQQSAQCVVETRQRWLQQHQITHSKTASKNVAEESNQLPLNRIRKGMKKCYSSKFPNFSNRFCKYAKFGRRKHRVKRFVEDQEKFVVKTAERLTPINPKSIPSRISNLIVNMFGAQRRQIDGTSTTNFTWTKAYKVLKEIRKETDLRNQHPGSLVYERRMYDIVLERTEKSMSPNERKSPKGFIRRAFDIIERIKNSNTVRPDSRGFKTLSPRFMPLTESIQPNNSNFLSPNILALFNDTNAIGNVPEILRQIGVEEHDRNSLISLLMDATRTTTHIKSAYELLKEMNFLPSELSEPFVAASNRGQKAFNSLEKSFEKHQKLQLNRDGFAFLRKNQIGKLLRDQVTSNADEVNLSVFDEYDRMQPEQQEAALWATIERIAQNKTLDAHRRTKRTLQTFVNVYVVLSPFMFAPSSGLVVIGALVLSPFMFSPGFLNAGVLMPFIFSPFIFSPFIISPFILSPFILSPVAFSPFILAPFALTPIIMIPFALSPMILSPFALSPGVLNYEAFGAAILSPAFASPSILSASNYSAVVLSPTFLS